MHLPLPARFSHAWAAGSTLLVTLVFTTGAGDAAPPNFDDHIRPIFEQSCTNCHNPDKAKGDLDLSTFSAAMRGGSGGKMAEPGEGAGSKLYGVITHTMEPKMPENGDKLGKKEADLIRAWIDAGMLENKSGKPRKKSKPAFSLKMTGSTGKPDGPPPMPRHPLLEPVVTPQRSSSVHDLASSPWAPLVAVAGQRQVLLYHSDSLELTAVLPFPDGQPEVLSFHPSGKYLLAGGGIGGKSGTTVTWEIETGKTILRAGKDFDSVLAASLRADLGGLSFGGPGKRVKLWDTQHDEPLVSIKKHTDWVTQLAYSPDGVLLASGGRGGGVYIWEAHTGNEFHSLRAHQAAITGITWRADSNLLASCSEDGQVIIWEMNRGRQAKKWSAHSGGVLSVHWTRNGHLVTSGRDKKVKIWKPDFTLLKELPAFQTMVVRVTFSHDGQRIFCADWQGSISVWDTASGKQVGSIAANPPTIARQIQQIQQQIADQPNQIKAAETQLQSNKKQLTSAQQSLSAKTTELKQATERKKQLTQKQAKLDSQIVTLQQQTNKIQSERDRIRKDINQAREALQQYAADILAARSLLQESQQFITQRQQDEIKLAKQAQLARQAADSQPDDPDQQEAASAALKTLTFHRQDTRTRQQQLEQTQAHLTSLTRQQQTPGNQLAQAEKQNIKIEQQWNSLQAQLKTAREKRQAINQPLAKINQQTAALEKQLQQHKTAFSKAKQSHQDASNRLQKIHQQNATLPQRLTHWQAAAINAKSIRLQQRADQQTAAYEQQILEFTRQSQQIANSKNLEQLKTNSRTLQQLRSSIEKQAATVWQSRKKALQEKQKYLKAYNLAHSKKATKAASP